MPRAHLVKSVPIERSPRVLQLEGMFEIPPSKLSWLNLAVDLPIERRAWNVGLIVGPSGCGKTTIAREFFGKHLVRGFDWPLHQSILDAFPLDMGIKEITGLLGSVGFCSPPSWLRPFHALSNGEQFRVTIARALAQDAELTVIDEFTSVVDRTVAQIGSAAVARCVRKRNQKLIALSCHYDIVPWLQPDWIYEPAGDRLQWRVLQQRPHLDLEIARVHHSLWKLFRNHHYLSTNLNKAATCFAGFIGGWPIAFTAVLSFPHPVRPGWREHRTVCLPDYQGIGLGIALGDYVASLFQATGKPYRSTTSNPAMIASREKSSLWKRTRPLSRVRCRHQGSLEAMKRTGSQSRMTASFEYVGPCRDFDAAAFGLTLKNAHRRLASF